MVNQNMRFVAKHACLQVQSQKGEDVIVVPNEKSQKLVRGDNYAVYAVCDGHAGIAAADFVAQKLNDEIKFQIHQEGLRLIWSTGKNKIIDAVQRCMKKVFLSLDSQFMKLNENSIAGTTLTVAVIMENILTVANVGDSKCILLSSDGHFLNMIAEHRLEVNEQEKLRIESLGGTVERLKLAGDLNGDGIGPLRMWPAGLAVSRSIGDKDARPFGTPFPAIKSMKLPAAGGRLIIASDGLWDFFSSRRVAAMIHRSKLEEVPGLLIRNVQTVSRNVMKDDTSVIAVDIFPHNQKTLYDCCATNSDLKFCCFQPKVIDEETLEEDRVFCFTHIKEIDSLFESQRNEPLPMYTSLPFFQEVDNVEDISQPSSHSSTQNLANEMSHELRGLKRSLSANWAQNLYSTQVISVDQRGNPCRRHSVYMPHLDSF
eukprot:TRINITY_DN8950_c1_g4_i2.p1 TRINITY_DN8950_c1_g4~~TRINITY_DN8950_c1_g4_i2.p1  ORF type:complete len:428 (-),score=32.81 TRINITY_DN8950_c1_g4_i2:5235-6518(-)